MFTITNGIILKGQDLTLTKENIVVDDGIIIDIGKDSMEGKIIDVDGAVVCPSFINGHMHIGDSIIKDEGYSLSLSEMVKPPDGVKHKALANAEDEEIISAMKDTMWEMVESGISKHSTKVPSSGRCCRRCHCPPDPKRRAGMPRDFLF